MSERWKFVGHHAHFVSFAVVGWVDVFTRAVYAEFLLKNLAYCRKSKGLVLYEFVIMPSHVHLGSARRIIIPVTFNGSVKAKLLLDTGAPGTVIFSSLAYRLGALDTSEGRLVTIASGLGGQRAAMLVVLDSLCVDAACTEFVPATVVEQISDAFEGLVGMDFLGGYQIDLDTRRHVLTLTENHRPDSPGGHDERWWRDTFAWFAREKQSWNRMHASLVTRVERLEAPPGLNLEQARQLVDFAAAQTKQIELLSNRLERHASFNSVPREWPFFYYLLLWICSTTYRIRSSQTQPILLHTPARN